MAWWNNDPYNDPRVTAINGSDDYDSDTSTDGTTWTAHAGGSECGASVKNEMAHAIENGHSIQVNGRVVTITDRDDNTRTRFVPRR